MAKLLKMPLFIIALIAAAKQCNASTEDSDNTPDGFQKFWMSNPYVLRHRTSDGTFDKCEWYHPMSCNVTGVTIKQSTYIPHTKRVIEYKGTKYWTFSNSSSMSWVSNNGDGCDKYLEYHDENYTCIVVRYKCYTNEDADVKEDLEDQCTTREPDAERCQDGRCKANQNEQGKYICKDNTYYEQLVTEDYITSVPGECTTSYEAKIGGKSDNKNREGEVGECKFKHEDS